MNCGTERNLWRCALIFTFLDCSVSPDRHPSVFLIACHAQVTAQSREIICRIAKGTLISCSLGALAISFSLGVLLQILVRAALSASRNCIQQHCSAFDLCMHACWRWCCSVGMRALAELVAAADSLHVRTGSDAIPLLRISIWRLILNLRRKQLGKRVRIMHLTCLSCFTSPRDSSF